MSDLPDFGENFHLGIPFTNDDLQHISKYTLKLMNRIYAVNGESSLLIHCKLKNKCSYEITEGHPLNLIGSDLLQIQPVLPWAVRQQIVEKINEILSANNFRHLKREIIQIIVATTLNLFLQGEINVVPQEPPRQN